LLVTGETALWKGEIAQQLAFKFVVQQGVKCRE
jgi:hypothetical protein